MHGFVISKIPFCNMDLIFFKCICRENVLRVANFVTIVLIFERWCCMHTSFITAELCLPLVRVGGILVATKGPNHEVLALFPVSLWFG